MIEVQGLTKRFVDKDVVSEVSFFVPEGEVLGFLGPNGAGKTTTMRMITGFLPPTAGSVRVAGLDLAGTPWGYGARSATCRRTSPSTRRCGWVST